MDSICCCRFRRRIIQKNESNQFKWLIFCSQPYFTVSFLLSFTFCCLHLFGFISIHVERYIEIDPGWSSHLMVIHVNIRVHILLARPPRTTSSMLKCLYICLKYFCILNDDASNFLLFRRYFSVGSARLFMLLLLLFRAPVCECVAYNSIYTVSVFVCIAAHFNAMNLSSLCESIDISWCKKSECDQEIEKTHTQPARARETEIKANNRLKKIVRF